MKRILLVFAILIMAFGTSSAKDIKIVTLYYPPYEYEEKGEIKGIAAEIVKEAFRSMNQTIKIEIHPWEKSLELMKNGEADAIFTVYKTPEREEFLLYSNEVLIPQIVSLFVAKDAFIKFDGDLSKMSRYKFGIVRGINYGSKFDESVKKGIIEKIETAENTEQNVSNLAAGKIDIMINNKYGGIDAIKKSKNNQAVIELSQEVESTPSYIAFSKKKNLHELRDRFDSSLKEMIATGIYRNILRSFE